MNVVDVNDNAPIFPSSFEGPFEITEGQPGPRVWTVKATDADSGSNGKVEYSITAGDLKSVCVCDGQLIQFQSEKVLVLIFVVFFVCSKNGFNPFYLCFFLSLFFPDEFVISSVEGELRVRRDVELDRETIAYYNITITAKDLGTPALSATVCTHTHISVHNHLLRTKV